MSRMRLNKNSRMKSALERRKEDVVNYTIKLNEAKSNKNQPTVVEFYTDKLSKASQEVKSLEGKVIGY